jgi:AraC-like DNA-binding protein
MNHLILWKNIRLFVGQNPRSTTGHSHPIIQLVVAINGEFKTLASETGEWIPQQGLLIKPNHQHQCDATNVAIFSLDIDPDSSLGEWILVNVMKGDPILAYPSDRFGQVNFELVDNCLQTENWDELYAHVETIFGFEDQYQHKTKDERIELVLRHIHDNIHDNLSTGQLTSVSFLSESRLLHLFKKEMGLPIRNYILWYRLKVALEQIINEASLTKAAHMAGFSDQSHFTRTCHKMIGVPPSLIAKNSRFVQVSFSS